MKKLLLSTISLLLFCCVFAQKKVEERFMVPTGKKAKLHFTFADDIKLEQWNNPNIKIMVTVDIDGGAGNNAYQLITEQNGDAYIIKDDYGDYLKNKSKDKKNCNTELHISYVVYVPTNSDLTVKSIAGNVFAQQFKGHLETDLVSGNVEIKKYDGLLNLKTVSGNLDIAMNKANIDAKTISGTIYSNLDIDVKNKGEKGMTSHIKGVLNSGTELVKLETVSGNIYMRKD